MPDKFKLSIGRILFRILLIILALVIIFIAYFILVSVDRPPEVTSYESMKTKRINYGNNTYVLGNNWLRKSESGLWEAYIEGNPFERGLAFGRLTRELLFFQETTFIEQIRELIPSDGYLRVLKYFVAFFNRNLDKNIPVEYQYEIFGTSISCSPEYNFIGSGYQRQLNYHAAHDIGHALQGMHMVGCTSFSVWNGSSADSSLLVARNFDFYMGKKFAENKIVCFVNPSEGFKFMMITWADMIGAVSGMNEKGLTVTLNAAKSSIPTQAATPVTILAREILQYASTIREAYEISKKRRLFVSESIMIGSAIDRRTAIIEKSPHASDLVYSSTDRLICSNHYQGRVFSNDEINLENIRGSDSYARYQRVKELLNRYKVLDVESGVKILRDRKSLGDIDAGMGNPLSINQLIAHHAVVFKPESLQVWISTAPWQLGRFMAYDLKKIFNLDIEKIKKHEEIASCALAIPSDTFLTSPAYRNFREFQIMKEQLHRYKKNREKLPDSFAEKYILSNPSLYLTYVYLGDYYNQMEMYDKAYSSYQAALTKKLPGLDEADRLKEIRNNLKKKLDNAKTRN
jgi:isopenicillin-N N-acyltransferase-like protein